MSSRSCPACAIDPNRCTVHGRRAQLVAAQRRNDLDMARASAELLTLLNRDDLVTLKCIARDRYDPDQLCGGETFLQRPAFVVRCNPTKPEEVYALPGTQYVCAQCGHVLDTMEALRHVRE